MIKKILIGLGVIIIAFAVFAFVITRPGSLVTPEGGGVIALEAGEFEAFPLPEYAQAFVGDDYKSYFVEVEPGIKIHVMEVGEGMPVYMQHGNPTSGFLYRKVAEELPKDQFRLIMPTMVGLGFSSKVPEDQHTLENHMRWMTAALAQLQISEAIYVGQDWGGPVGMGAMARTPGLMRGAVVMNTGFTAPTEKRDLSSAHAMVKTPVVGEMALEVFGSIFDRLPGAQGDPESMPEDVRALYGRPVEESGNAKAPVALMRMVPDGPDHPSATQMREIEAYVATLDVPVEIVWGVNDPILGSALPTMQANLPNAPTTETEAGHFLQEEVPGEIARAVLRVASQLEAGELETEEEL
ncbi:alpha/beta fold hydrolase [uncultured Erythrobacter sp.]|uniref:alpha/beta fold hydrolase n=1 Tax=uncultured Erythrobacter sp. TaxID=263913 RepID=UPI00262500F7|nr:alpha/beta fold hydrolase [uncultured Erythrobacter sp.]